MPRFGCHCGASIPLHGIPNEHEGVLIWDVDREAADEAGRDPIARLVVRCPDCGRLFVQREPGKNEYVSYVREPPVG